MLIVERVSVMNFENAIRGARNPMNSWDRMDSYIDESGKFIMGKGDLDLAHRLCVAGSTHRKFVRQIMVSMDITAPLYWWKEFDTYKVGVTANSTSTMHKIHSKPIDRGDFSYDHLGDESLQVFDGFVNYIEQKRLQYLTHKDKKDWYEIIQLLPSSYNQMRTCTMDYENLYNIYESRKNHKLDEWHTLCDEIVKLPYFAEMFDIKPVEKKKVIEDEVSR